VSLRARSYWLSAAVLLMAWLAFPSFFPEATRQASAWIPDQGVRLGLDLQGGIHWLLRIDETTAVRQELARDLTVLREAAEERQIPGGSLAVTESLEIELGTEAEKLRPLLDEVVGNLEPVASGSTRYRLTEEWRGEVRVRGMRQALEVLRRRIDSLGVTEPVLAPQGDDRILVQMPGEISPERARGILEKTTFLEFKPVLASAPNQELLESRYAGGLPADTKIVFSHSDQGEVTEAFLVPIEPVLTGSLLEDARIGFDRRNRPLVLFQWNSDGAKIFREFTGEHVGDRLAAIIDGEVVTAPVIRSRIGARGQIEGDFTHQEAADLAVKLRSGALPIPLIIEEERQIGPSLGGDSISAGVRATALGGLGVFVFMLIYYASSGLIANVTLLLDLIAVLAAMGLAGATLTLPGIAGLLLTVGMAVDANVIIYERIREELRAGKTMRNAVQIGFKRSTLTILDANVTTLITAIILYYFGSGPIQGFGVSLAIGLVVSVPIALVGTRWLVDLWLAAAPERLRV
jgi:preprotein translocase subunit SecD